MRNKIISIKEKVPQVTTLPDGYYNGIWGGSIIEVNFDKRRFELESENEVRGMGIEVVVEIKDGVATFEELKS